MLHIMKNHKWSTLLLCIVVLLALFVAGCGGAVTSSSGSSAANIPAPVSDQNPQYHYGGERYAASSQRLAIMD
jgi:hypothetical protein